MWGHPVKPKKLSEARTISYRVLKPISFENEEGIFEISAGQPIEAEVMVSPREMWDKPTHWRVEAVKLQGIPFPLDLYQRLIREKFLLKA